MAVRRNLYCRNCSVYMDSTIPERQSWAIKVSNSEFDYLGLTKLQLRETPSVSAADYITIAGEAAPIFEII